MRIGPLRSRLWPVRERSQMHRDGARVSASVHTTTHCTLASTRCRDIANTAYCAHSIVFALLFAWCLRAMHTVYRDCQVLDVHDDLCPRNDRMRRCCATTVLRCGIQACPHEAVPLQKASHLHAGTCTLQGKRQHLRYQLSHSTRLDLRHSDPYTDNAVVMTASRSPPYCDSA